MSGAGWGILIMLVSTSIMNVGMVIQKKAVDGLPPLGELGLLTGIKSVLGSWLWVAGWVMTTTAIVMNMIALGLADISIIQPLNGFGIVVLALVSRWFLKERLNASMVGGMAATIIGVVLIGVTAPPSRMFGSGNEILGCYTHPWALVTLSLFISLLLLGLLAGPRIKGRIAGIHYAILAASASVIGLTFSKGLFSMFNVDGIKATLVLPPAYLIMFLGVGFATLAIALQQISFQKGRAVVVTPVFSASQVALPLAFGLGVFGETVSIYTLLAIVAISIGVVLLGATRQEATDP